MLASRYRIVVGQASREAQSDIAKAVGDIFLDAWAAIAGGIMDAMAATLQTHPRDDTRFQKNAHY